MNSATILWLLENPTLYLLATDCMQLPVANLETAIATLVSTRIGSRNIVLHFCNNGALAEQM
jgi:hypothetical protein